MAFAFCFRSGEIEIGRRVPAGAICIARGRKPALSEFICAVSRHAYDGKTLLVPGVPEAPDDDAAVDALTAFVDWIKPSANRRGIRVSLS